MKQFVGIVAILSMGLASSPVFAGKYDGTWNFRVQTTQGNCSASSSAVEIVNGKIKGTLLSEGARSRIHGSVKDDGSAKGKFGIGDGNFSGQFSNNNGVGDWKSRFGCAGKIFITR